MKGHTGATLSLGKGGIYSGSWKQRLVARSSTESELVSVYDVLLQVLWMKKFLEEQGWLNSATVVYQDNTSSILLERNGRSSSTKHTKHMNIRYFYLTEQIKKKAIHVTHCITGEMVGDFITTHLQGSLFIKMRKYIIGVEEHGYQVLPRSVLSIHDKKGIRNQKFIGTQKHNAEVEKMGDEHVTKDSDGSTRDVAIKNIQGTSLYTKSVDIGGDDTKGKRRGEMNRHVAPRSYRDVVVNGKVCHAMT